ncbi:hypothetical protein M3210_02815 [Oceanobacillus luteolus]|uniref:hypothetical protein n=1 Tax=Oceanobacillus luteolus TaxID=1274358 RepID=UPI00203EB286|nr:hypothetical protein [Oceanobacillus luteolus]MCM3739194.1 hypothetical protein [Oceanobacillus luteolus]
MNFEEHFLPGDIPAAKLAFYNIVTSLKLIESYERKGDKANVKRISNNLLNALTDINALAVRKDETTELYLHHLLTKPQGWYPM